MIQLLRLLRGLRRAPAFAIAVLTLLVLATGANTAIFGVARAVLLRPVPWPSPERLVAVWETGPGEFGDEVGIGLPDYFDWSRERRAFESMAAFATGGFGLVSGGEPEHVEGAVVSATLLPLLGAEPSLGRNFRPAEEQPGAEPSVLLSHGLWGRRFGADPGVLGTTVTIAGTPRTVVGVLPAGLRTPFVADVWLPLGHYTGNVRLWRASHPLTVLARVREGVSVTEAEQRLAARARAIWAGEPAPLGWDGWSVRLVPIGDQLFGDYRSTVRLLWCAVGLVLLVALFNLANLFLGRLASRRRELAVREALGAGTLRLAGTVAGEAAVLAGLGAAGGLLLAGALLDALGSLLPPKLLHLAHLEVDRETMVLALLVAVGLVALALTAAAAGQRLAAGSRAAAGGSRGGARSPSRGLVVAQFALTVPLLLAALLLFDSIGNLRRADSGIAAAQALSFRTTLPAARYPTPESRRAFYERVAERLSAAPQVRTVAYGSNIPFSRLGVSTSTSVFVHGRPMEGERAAADVRAVSIGYFRALGTRLVRGRAFVRADEDGPRVALVNESMAQRTWPGGDPLGQRILDGSDPGFDESDPTRWFTVVGVVRDARSGGVRAEPVPEVYVPAAKRPLSAMTFVVRAGGPLSPLVDRVRREVVAVDPQQSVSQVATLAELVDESIGRERLALALITGLAGLALLVAAVGVYGVVSYGVSAGRRGLAVRGALGARSIDLLAHVLGRSAAMAAAGSALGLVLGAATARWLEGLLYGVGTTEPAMLVAVFAGALCVGLAAALGPAARAARTDPAAVLRDG